MTRIIAGTAGGRRLRTPTGERTRPTSDRVREALFSSIESDLGAIAGLRFLDLYAGSGAVGLEARSRGAGVVTLVEHDKRTVALIRANVASLRFSQVEVRAGSVPHVLAGMPTAPYDIVFCDPPYALPADAVDADVTSLCHHGWLAQGALIVVERSSRAPGPAWPDGIEPARSRRYGETTLWYGHAVAVTS
jgi:16S rRNA (guanine966-N2)-methyltransferase